MDETSKGSRLIQADIQAAADGGSSCEPSGCTEASRPGKETGAPGMSLAYPEESRVGRRSRRMQGDSRGGASGPVGPCYRRAYSSYRRPR